MADDLTLGEQNYNQFADRYADRVPDKPHNAYYDRPAVLSLLPDVTNLQVLDAGCGPGIYSQWLLDHGATVTAIDVTPRMVEITKERLKAYPADRVTAFRHDLQQPLDFAADAQFDLVIAPLVLDYIAEWTPVFREFARVLKPGGMFVFSCGHPHGDYNWLHHKNGEDVNYFERELFTTPWGGFGEPKPQVSTYRRPLQMMLNPIIDAGLSIDHIHEPKPTEKFAELDPKHYAELMELPAFICVRAKKAGA